MLSDEDVQTNSYAGRTGTVIDQPDIFGEDCDEINLGNEDTPPSKLRLHASSDSERSSSLINSIEDHDDYMSNHQDNHYAQISPEPVPTNFKVIIREFEKRGDGMNAYIVYKLETEVSGVVGYNKQHFETWRRFSDFLGLHGKIVEKYLIKGIVIPQPPEKSFSALTKTKTNSDPARNDCDVRDFLTIESDLPKAVQTTTLSSFGVKKLFHPEYTAERVACQLVQTALTNISLVVSVKIDGGFYCSSCDDRWPSFARVSGLPAAVAKHYFDRHGRVNSTRNVCVLLNSDGSYIFSRNPYKIFRFASNNDDTTDSTTEESEVSISLQNLSISHDTTSEIDGFEPSEGDRFETSLNDGFTDLDVNDLKCRHKSSETTELQRKVLKSQLEISEKKLKKCGH